MDTQVSCKNCQRVFSSQKGLSVHLAKCNRVHNPPPVRQPQPPPAQPQQPASSASSPFQGNPFAQFPFPFPGITGNGTGNNSNGNGNVTTNTTTNVRTVTNIDDLPPEARDQVKQILEGLQFLRKPTQTPVQEVRQDEVCCPHCTKKFNITININRFPTELELLLKHTPNDMLSMPTNLNDKDFKFYTHHMKKPLIEYFKDDVNPDEGADKYANDLLRYPQNAFIRPSNKHKAICCFYRNKAWDYEDADTASGVVTFYVIQQLIRELENHEDFKNRDYVIKEMKDRLESTREDILYFDDYEKTSA